MTIPQRAFFEASLANGSKVRVGADGPGRLSVEQIELPAWAKPEGAENAQGPPPEAAPGRSDPSQR